MIDIHSHILYGIDDGAKNIDDSVSLINSAIKNNVKKIILTPHYIVESNSITPNKTKKEILNKIKKQVSSEVELYLGNEIYMDDDIASLIDANKIMPLANSKYLLIELPIYNEYPNLENKLFSLRNLGYKIIIAHPERYYYFKNDFSKLLKLCKQGIYFQGNYMSLYDIYGKSTKKLFLKILKHHCYSFMASDIHMPSQKYYDKISDAKAKIAKITNKSYCDDIFYNNADKIIKNEEVENSYKEKISIFDRIRGNK